MYSINYFIKRTIILLAVLFIVYHVKADEYKLNLLRQEVTLQTHITGVVVDENKEPLVGVDIIIWGTTKGTTTNSNGEFTIDAEQGNVLIISIFGYKSKEITIGKDPYLMIQLEPEIEKLNEVVVIGYGKIKKGDLTGSVASLSAKEIGKANKVNSFQALQGAVPGVDIKSQSNKPGGGFQVQVRGFNSITGSSQPLYVVDGVFLSDISVINPSDIGKIDVLKDASATAIYGSRAANGVVIIQTKQGKSGQTVISYDSYIGFKQAYNLPRIFKGEEFVQFARDAALGRYYAAGQTGEIVKDESIFDANELKNIANGNYTDYVDLIQRTAFTTNHSINVSGGANGLVYNFGGGATIDQGTVKPEEFSRYNLKTSVAKQVNKILKLGVNSYFTYDIRNEGSYESFRNAYRSRPTTSAYDEEGNRRFFTSEKDNQITNPLFDLDNTNRETRGIGFFGNIFINLTPIKHVDFTTTFSPDMRFERYGRYDGLYTKTAKGDQKNTRAYYNTYNKFAYTFDNILKYTNSFNDYNKMEGTFVFSLWNQRKDGINTQLRGYSSDIYQFYNLSAASDVRELSSFYEKQSLVSYVGRLNYTFRNKYLLTVTGRYDGSSKLAKGNQWFFFPSAALGWKISEEKFLKYNSTISDLKLRLSYGKSGNDNIAPYQSQAQITPSFYTFGDEVVRTSQVSTLANEDLTWETTQEYNLGIDFGLFHNRVSGTLDLYRRKSKDLLMERKLPSTTGFTSTLENIGSVSNKGIEIAMNTININSQNFRWTSKINFAANKNKIEKLYGNDLDDIGNKWFLGRPVQVNYDYVYDAIWQLDEVDKAHEYFQEPGQVKIKDLNSDGIIDDKDKAIIGSPFPKWTGGLLNNFSYKNLDLTIFIHTRQGVKVLSQFHEKFAWDQDYRPARFNGLKTNYWTPNNPTNDWHQPGNPGSYQSAAHYQDASFVKIGYISLGYNFKDASPLKGIFKQFTVYLTAQNPWVFTKYDGWDPEIASENTYGGAFLARSFLLGLNVTL